MAYRRSAELTINRLSKMPDKALAMNEKMLKNNVETAFTKSILKSQNGNVADKIMAIKKKDSNFNRTTVAKELNISRVTLYKYLKEMEDKK